MRTNAGINLVLILLGRYLEYDVRVDTQEKTAGKERKRGKKKGKRALSSAETNGSNCR